MIYSKVVSWVLHQVEERRQQDEADESGASDGKLSRELVLVCLGNFIKIAICREKIRAF